MMDGIVYGTVPLFSEFPEILGELSMRKQCVPGSFLSAHAQEPGNEASDTPRPDIGGAPEAVDGEVVVAAEVVAVVG